MGAVRSYKLKDGAREKKRGEDDCEAKAACIFETVKVSCC